MHVLLRKRTRNLQKDTEKERPQVVRKTRTMFHLEGQGK